MKEFSSFITNDENSLLDIIIDISPKTRHWYFLVGYFYFSAFSAIYKEAKDKNIKILVGMDIERDLGKVFKEVYRLDYEYKSYEEVRQNFYKSFVDFVNTSDYFENISNQEAFRIFLKKLEEGTLEVRKTLRPSHAKMYIFEFDESEAIAFTTPGIVIVGSSNLTYSGLTRQYEINTILREPEYFKKAKEIFEQLWEEAAPIADKHILEEFKKEVVEKIWIDKIPDPYLMYIRALHEYFEAIKIRTEYLPSKITKNKFYDLKYQIDAIERALSILRQHNGVIIADVVGLGKSIIASSIAHVLRLKTVVIAPPHLKENWENYIIDFDFNGKFFSSGKLEDALRFVERDNDEKLIIVDEAHRYRNENTETYSILHKICSGNKVILLSATPFNNAPFDILAMIKLFQIPGNTTLGNWGNLQTIFLELQNEFKKAQKNQDKALIEVISKKIQNIISPVVIRRTRLDLKEIEEYAKDLEAQGVGFPKVHDPKILRYDLGELKNLYIRTLEKIAPSSNDKKKYFKATRYKPVTYLKRIEAYRQKLVEYFGTEDFELSQRNISEFMRKLLVLRFESSVFAFKISLENMIKATENMIKWYEFGKVPICKRGGLLDPQEIFEDDVIRDDEEELPMSIKTKLAELEEKGYFFIDSKEIRKVFLEDLKSDLEILQEIYDEWRRITNFDNFDKTFDPKFEYFKEHLKQLLDDPKIQKIVVFSQYADTVNYLYQKLKNELKVLKYTSQDRDKHKLIQKEFDAMYEERSDNYRILIATDAISEGFNLNRANVIINYDIPYNPMRVVQRIGRLNRIGRSIQNEIFIYNYFPTVIGEEETSVSKIAQAKIHLFNYLFGSDTKVLSSEEELVSYFMEEYKKLEETEKSWDVEFLNELNRVRTYHREIYEKALKLPPKVRIKIQNANRNGALFFTKRRDTILFEYVTDTDYKILSPEEGLRIFKEMSKKRAGKTSERLEHLYKLLKSKKEKDVTKLDEASKKLLEWISYLRSRIKEHGEYLKKLDKVIKYSALPKHLLREGRNILNASRNEELTKAVERLKELIPENYLDKILAQIQRYVGEDTIILIEEFDNNDSSIKYDYPQN